MSKPISEWTIEDCETNEYWKTLFRLATSIKLSALDGEYLSGWAGTRLFRITGENKIVTNKMFKDLFECQFLQGCFDNNELVYAKAIWHLPPTAEETVWSEEEKRIFQSMAMKHTPLSKIDTQNSS